MSPVAAMYQAFADQFGYEESTEDERRLGEDLKAAVEALRVMDVERARVTLEAWEDESFEIGKEAGFAKGHELGFRDACNLLMGHNNERFKAVGDALAELHELATTGIGKSSKDREEAEDAIERCVIAVITRVTEIKMSIESGKRDFSNENGNQAPATQEIQADEGPGEASTDQQG